MIPDLLLPWQLWTLNLMQPGQFAKFIRELVQPPRRCNPMNGKRETQSVPLVGFLLKFFLGLIQGLQQISDQVAWIFQPDRQADQAGADPQRVFLFLRQTLVGRRGRVGGDGFRICEIV